MARLARVSPIEGSQHIIQSEKYLLELHRYIELNPVRANRVDKPSDYSGSSYSCNALGIETELLKADIRVELLKEIRKSVNKGLALGNEPFTRQIEALTKKRIPPRKAGAKK